MSMPQPRIIRKYNNRRLYDTETSAYITQDTVKEYVSKGIAFRVETAKTGEDITRAVLLHIILDEEIMGVPLFTEQALRSIIMFSGSTMRSSFAGFFEQMLPMLQNAGNPPDMGVFPGVQEANERFREQMATMQGMMLGNAFMENIHRNMKMVEEVNKTIVQNTAEIMKPKPKPGKGKGRK